MTEKEKFLVCKPYFPWDPELKADRVRAKRLCHQFNQAHSEPLEVQTGILAELLGKVSSATIEPHFYCDYGYNIELGENFYSNHNCVILDCAPVKIGNNVMFGPNVTLTAAGHPLDAETRNTGIEFAEPITLGDNVWLGANVTVNPGVTIGDNVVIGSGSVVTRDIPANTVAVGVPCRVIKELDPK